MHEKKSRLVTVGILAVLLLSVLIGSAIGKYTTTVPVSGTVTFTAKLATAMTVQEHKAQQNTDGSYTLSTTETVTTNTYNLLPGLDIPKDPHVVITGKTAIASYLYLKVEEAPAATSGITYDLASCWKRVDGYADVYVYSDGEGKPIQVTDKTTGLDKIEILQDNTVYVSQSLADTLTGVKLSFSAVLKEIGTGNTPAAVYGRIN